MKSREKEEHRKKWERHIREWEKSGLKQIDFCRLHKISDKCFYYWKKRFHVNNKQISFVQIPVSLPEKICKIDSLNIVLPNDIRIEISESFNSEMLKKAVETLRRIS